MNCTAYATAILTLSRLAFLSRTEPIRLVIGRKKNEYTGHSDTVQFAYTYDLSPCNTLFIQDVSVYTTISNHHITLVATLDKSFGWFSCTFVVVHLQCV